MTEQEKIMTKILTKMKVTNKGLIELQSDITYLSAQFRILNELMGELKEWQDGNCS